MDGTVYHFAALRFYEDENICDRVYWYFAPFPVKEEMLVLAPVGSHNRLQLARVERTMSADSANAPYDVRLIKRLTAPVGARRFPIFKNCRDLGGIRYDSKRFTRYRTFLRAAFPETVSEKEYKLCKRYNINAYVDFRNGGETPHNINIIPCPLPKSDFLTVMESENAHRALSCLAEAEGCVLFGCEDGTEGTGAISAILLLLANVSEAEVLADYFLSAGPMSGDKIKVLLTEIKKFGGAEEYLYDLGVNKETVQRLKEKLH